MKRRMLSSCLLCLALFGCDRPKSSPPPAPAQKSAAIQKLPPAEVADRGRDEPAAPADEKSREVAILAGGCFWGMEDILRDIDGVIDTEVGYAGGTVASPTYKQVKTGETGHAESVRIVFDKTKLTFEDLLEDWFFRMHDPTTENRQGNDVGSQYRSAVFFTSAEQKATAERVIERVGQSGQWDAPIVTEVSAAGGFTPAESYHQNYLEKNPGGYTCHFMRDPVY